MKKMNVTIIILTLGIMLTACSSPSVVDEPEHNKEVEYIDVNKLDNRAVSCSYGYANMSVVIPKDWDYEVTDYSLGIGSFGISFKPEGMPGSVGIYYYTQGFGVCGTGLYEEKIDIGENLKGTVGIYDEAEIWNFIILENVAGPYVVMVEGNVETWWNENYDMLMSILSTIEVGKGQITNEEAISLAAKLCPEGYANKYPNFNVENGSWTIDFESKDFSDEMTVRVDAEGNATLL